MAGRAWLAAAALPFLALGCAASAPVAPGSAAGATDATAIAENASCGLALHAILREADATSVVGQVQFRIKPAGDGSAAEVSYAGTFGPLANDYLSLSVAVVPRLPGDQGPTWTDVGKSDPGLTLSQIAHFGRTGVMSNALALALVDAPDRYKAIVNVDGSTGGREAEGVVAPREGAPEPIRDHQRRCFGG